MMVVIFVLVNDFESCVIVWLFDFGWIDIIVMNGVVNVVLIGFGYKFDIKILFVLIGYEVLKNGEIDVFFGNWMLVQQKFCDDLEVLGKIEELVQNFEGVKFMLVVIDVVKDLNIKDFVDLDVYKDVFDGKIYGIELGVFVNQFIVMMIVDDKFGFGDWELVELGEQVMLVQVVCNDVVGKFLVFLVWVLYLMNVNFVIIYLLGGDVEFGLDFGGVIVYIVVCKVWVEECLNVVKLFKQMVFSVDQENMLMGNILNELIDFVDVVKVWIEVNFEFVVKWLDGVMMFDG